MLIRKTNLTALLLLFSFFLKAQFYQLERFSEADGLVSSGVNTIFQDQRGYLWIGTGSGLSKFNGYDFINYTTEDGLQNNFIKCIHEGNDGKLYVANNRGLDVIDLKNIPQSGFKSLFVDGTVTSILTFEDKLFFGTNSGLHFKSKSDSSIDFIELRNIRSLLIQDRKIMIGAEKGLFSFDVDSKNLDRIWFDESERTSFVRTIVQIEKNHFWLGTMDGMVEVKDGLKIKKLSSNDGLTYNRIPHLSKDVYGRIWVAAENGLSIIRNNGDIFNFSETDFSESCVYTLEDNQGSIWIATFTGLLRYSEYAFDRLDTEGIADKGISSVLQRANGDVWLGGAEGNILIQKKTGDLEIFESIKSKTDKKPIHRLFEDKSGRVWITTLFNGIYIWDDESLKSFDEPKKATQFFSFAIKEADSGEFWIGGARSLLYHSDTTFKYFDNKSAESIFAIDINTDSRNQNWVTLNDGLALISDIDSGIVKIHEFDGITCGTIIELEPFKYAISTNNYGIFFFTYKNSRIDIYDTLTVSDGLSNNNVNALYLDDSGILWAGTDYGVNRISKEGAITIFKVNENLLASRAYLNAIISTSTDIVIGTYDGVMEIPRRLKKQKLPTPEIYITKVEILTDNYNSTSQEFNNGAGYGVSNNFTLPYNANYILFEFEGLSFSDQNEVEYSIMLEGLDNEYSSPKKDRSFTYTNLEPGDYTFHVKSKNSDNVWSEPATISFIITPPFWKEWWFQFASFLLLLASTFSLINWRISLIRKEEQEKSELNKKIAEFRLTALRAQMNPHFIFNALYSIQHFITTNEKEAAINYLAKFANLIRSILENSGRNVIALTEEIKMLDLYLALESLRFDHKFSYAFDVAEDINKDDIAIPYLLIQPFIENSIIHGIRYKKGKGKIEIKFKNANDEDFILCTIEDDGVGREKASILSKPSPIKSQSLGLKVNQERLEVLNPGKINDKSVKIVDLKNESGEGIGTRVEIKIPISYNEL